MNPDSYLEMAITVALLLAELAVMAICIIRARRPPNPAKPRLFPYAFVSVFLALGIVVTTAHTYSVYTGKKLEAKIKRPVGGGMMR